MIRRLKERFLDRYVRAPFGTTAERLADSGPYAVPRRPATRDRVASLRKHVRRDSKVLEFGPLSAPILAKRDGWNVFSIDNADRDGLVKRHEGIPFVRLDLIEEVDFVWTGGSLLAAIPPEHHGTFDVVIMSHVMEHFPDPLRILGEIAALLSPDGHLSLAFPDKRHCFDAFRPVTRTSEWLEARMRGDRANTRQTLFDYFVHSVGMPGQIGWVDTRIGVEKLDIMRSLEEFHATYYGPNPPEGFMDCHAWVCTPASFALLVHECHALGASPLALLDITDSHLGEFLAHLTRAPRPAFNKYQRLQLMALSAQEQASGYAGLKPARADPIRALVRWFVRR
jgi:SAM-dependent methyltransferase